MEEEAEKIERKSFLIRQINEKKKKKILIAILITMLVPLSYLVGNFINEILWLKLSLRVHNHLISIYSINADIRE